MNFLLHTYIAVPIWGLSILIPTFVDKLHAFNRLTDIICRIVTLVDFFTSVKLGKWQTFEAKMSIKVGNEWLLIKKFAKVRQSPSIWSFW